MPTPTQGFLGYVKVGPAATPTNKVSDVTDISTPWTAAEYDTTNMNADANNGFTQVIPGLKSGKLAIKANYIPGDTNGQAVMIAAWGVGTLLYVIVSINGTNTQTFTGYVADFQPHGPVNNKTDVTFNITVSGAVVFA
jgi:hypothetical protein